MNSNQLHELATWSIFFKDILDRRKSFVLRKKDRDFHCGDQLWLREYDPDFRAYTGREATAKISYILDAPCPGLADEYCILSLVDIESSHDEFR